MTISPVLFQPETQRVADSVESIDAANAGWLARAVSLGLLSFPYIFPSAPDKDGIVVNIFGAVDGTTEAGERSSVGVTDEMLLAQVSRIAIELLENPRFDADVLHAIYDKPEELYI